jgi:ATP-dependent DNA ligase
MSAEQEPDNPYYPFPRLLVDDDLANIDANILTGIKARIAAYRQRFPHGEPSYKRKAPYRVFIYAEDIMLMKGKSLRTAQRVLQNTRILLEKKPNSDVTITEFCTVNDWPLDETQAFLNRLDEIKYNDMEK